MRLSARSELELSCDELRYYFYSFSFFMQTRTKIDSRCSLYQGEQVRRYGVRKGREYGSTL